MCENETTKCFLLESGHVVKNVLLSVIDLTQIPSSLAKGKLIRDLCVAVLLEWPRVFLSN